MDVYSSQFRQRFKPIAALNRDYEKRLKLLKAIFSVGEKDPYLDLVADKLRSSSGEKENLKAINRLFPRELIRFIKTYRNIVVKDTYVLAPNESEKLTVSNDMDEYYLASAKKIVPGEILTTSSNRGGALFSFDDLSSKTSLLIPGSIRDVKKFTNASIDPALKELTEPIEGLFNTSYGVDWSKKKLARDILQNFFDGHGQTLNGVYLDIDPAADGSYRVTIVGESEFNYELLIDLGATTKSFDKNASGFFGEGSKVVPLIMLRNGLAEHFQYGSCNWRLTPYVGTNSFDREKIFYKLELSENIEGNYITFKTKDIDFVKDICEAVNFFRHDSNSDFIGIDYENSMGGFKLLEPNEMGNVYVAGQRFEVMHEDKSLSPVFSWEKAFPGSSVFVNSKLDSTGRDRPAIHKKEVKDKIISPVVRRMSGEDIAAYIFKLKPLWSFDRKHLEIAVHDKKSLNINHEILSALVEEASTRGLVMDFPNDVVSFTLDQNSLAKYDLSVKNNLQPCFPEFERLGMKRVSINSFMLDGIYQLVPTSVEAAKLSILKQASKIIRKEFTHDLSSRDIITLNDINSESGVFEQAENPRKKIRAFYYGGEIWWKRSSLKKINFFEALSVHLHELAHKYGEDKSRIFTVKVKNWIKAVIASASQNNVFYRLHALNYLWGNLTELQSSEIDPLELKEANP